MQMKLLLRFIFIFLLLFHNINSQEPCQSCSIDASTLSCGSCNCKFKYSDSLCYDCSSVLSNVNDYYSIDENGICSNTCSGNKIIEDTKECTSAQSTDLYLLGDIYQSTDPSNGNTNANIDAILIKFANAKNIFILLI